MTYFFSFYHLVYSLLEQTSKTPHYETNLVPSISEAPATHVVPPTSVQDQATTISSVTPTVQATPVDDDDDDDNAVYNH